MFNRPVKEINAEFLAEEKYLDSIQRTVKESCAAASMSRKDTQAVLLAIEEGATNIIRHAYLYEKGMIRLRVIIYKKLIVFSLIDFGRSFQPDDTGTLDLQRLVESGRKGGLGFYMIQKIMNSVEYISSAGLNELRMVKRIKGPSRAGRPFVRRMFTLRVKFSVWTFMVMLVIIGGSFYFINDRITRQEFTQHNQKILALATTMADEASGHFINRRSDVEFDELAVSYRRANPELVRVILTDANGIIRAHSDDIRNIRKPYSPPGGVQTRITGQAQIFTDGNRTLNYLIVPVMTGERVIGLTHTIYTSEHIYKRLASARVEIVILTVILILIGIFGIYLLSNYFVSPIVKITRRVRRFTSGDIESELPLEGAEEFFEISKAFNQMMTRLSQDRKNIVEREKMAKEIEVASQIQQTLLPRELPNLPGLEVKGFYRAASMVGGDLYDVFRIGEHRFCLTVADVSGKGVPASLVMSMLRTVIQIQASTSESAKSTLVKVNRYLEDNIPPGMFVTVFLVIYDALTHSISCVSAGHNPMLYYSAAEKRFSKINPGGMPLGIPAVAETSFESRLEELSMTMASGDLFFLFTDGVTEATDREGAQYGMERLTTFLETQLAGNGIDSVTSLADTVVGEIDDFSGYVQASDDITFLIARCRLDDETDGPAAKSEKAAEVEITRISDNAGESADNE
ncbi:MAG: SpoIIE family protein phosphatase [candidate division Zixibacteria bacterium]|nr:SpoIIE family protein phosphatase [candidate division Zixibacteria bacterium]